MDKFEIINRIGYIRTRAKLTQKALSIDINLNEGYINRLENKRDFLPSMEVLLRIIDTCASTPEEFFYHDIFSYKRDKEHLEDMQGLDDPTKSLVKVLLYRLKTGKVNSDKLP